MDTSGPAEWVPVKLVPEPVVMRVVFGSRSGLRSMKGKFRRRRRRTSRWDLWEVGLVKEEMLSATYPYADADAAIVFFDLH